MTIRSKQRPIARVALVFIAATVALACVASASSTGRYTDATGDSRAAPDVRSISIGSDPTGHILFSLEIAGVEPDSDTSTFLLLNTDMNEATGAPDTLGSDYLLAVHEIDYSYGFARWTGSDWDFDQPHSSALRIVSRRTGYTISMHRSDLGETSAFTFWVRTVRGDDSDDAPDDGAWSYSLAAGGPEIRGVLVATTPAAGPRAGRPFTVTPAGLRLPSPVTGANAVPKPESYACRATLGVRPLRGTGRGRCTWRLPRSARGQRLVVVLTVSYQGASKRVRFVYGVRR